MCDCENVINDGDPDCSELFNCCDCGAEDGELGCGCAYCWSCNACDVCKAED